MFLQTDGLSPPSPLRPLSVLVLHLLIHSCRGQSQMIGPPHPIVARVGDDVILPCHLEPAADVSAEILEWKRHDLKPEFVFVLRSGQDLHNVKNPSYRGRTSVFMDELKHGNVSLKLSKVQLSDQGTYECDLPLLHKQSSVKFMIASDTASSPEITLLGVDKQRRVILHCESEGWYADTEVLWLDGEGNLLSAGPPETVRGPDDLYTVSSRVTVEKRHSNRFTCRVQQENINQTREAHIHVPDDFFKVQSRSSYIIIGLTVSLAVCILIILFFFVKWRLNKNKMDETDTGEKRKHYKTEEEREREQLTTDETVPMKVLKAKKKEKKKSKHHDGSSSAKRLVIEVDQGATGKYISLRSTSCQDQRLGGTMLKFQINNKKPVSFTFDPSFILKAGQTVTMWVPGYGTNNPPTDLIWRGLKTWSTKDHLQVDLFNSAR